MQSRQAQQTITPFNFYHGAGQIYINITQAATAKAAEVRAAEARAAEARAEAATTSLDSGAALQIGSLWARRLDRQSGKLISRRSWPFLFHLFFSCC